MITRIVQIMRENRNNKLIVVQLRFEVIKIDQIRIVKLIDSNRVSEWDIEVVLKKKINLILVTEGKRF